MLTYPKESHLVTTRSEWMSIMSFWYRAQQAPNKDKFLKLPLFQKNIKYNFDALYSYSTKITHLNLLGRTIVKLGKWSPTSTTHYN